MLRVLAERPSLLLPLQVLMRHGVKGLPIGFRRRIALLGDGIDLVDGDLPARLGERKFGIGAKRHSALPAIEPVAVAPVDAAPRIQDAQKEAPAIRVATSGLSEDVEGCGQPTGLTFVSGDLRN